MIFFTSIAIIKFQVSSISHSRDIARGLLIC